MRATVLETILELFEEELNMCLGSTQSILVDEIVPNVLSTDYKEFRVLDV